MDDLVKRADEALKDVTPGPWDATADESAVQVKGFPILESADYVIVGLEGFYDDFDTDWANARFIAAARELVPAMRDRIEADAARIAELEASLDSHHAEVGSNIWRFWRDEARKRLADKHQARGRALTLEAALRETSDALASAQESIATFVGVHGYPTDSGAVDILNEVTSALKTSRAALEGEKT